MLCDRQYNIEEESKYSQKNLSRKKIIVEDLNLFF